MMLFHEGLKQLEGHPKEALIIFEEVIRLMPERWEAHYNLGIISMALSDIEKAEKEFQRALKNKGSAVKIYHALGALYQSEGKKKKAIEALEKAAKNEKSSIVMINLANLYQTIDEKEKAFKYYEEAKTLDPSNQILHYNLGILLYKMGKFEKAKEEFLQAAGSFGEESKLLLLQAQTLFKLREYEAALKMFQKITEKNPSDPTPYKSIGIIYEIYLGNMKKAQENYTMYLNKGGEQTRLVRSWIDMLKVRQIKGKKQDEG
jgi:tetratricopeptide (TPR) repeat protein